MSRVPILLPIVLVAALPTARAQSEAEGRLLYQFRLNHLQQNVGLPEDEARMVVERWARYDRELFQTIREIREIRAQFNDILMGPGSEGEKNAKVKPLLDQFVALRHQQMHLKIQFEDDIRAHLSPAQQVRLILQVDELQRRMVEALRQGLGNRPGMGGPGMGLGNRQGQGPGGVRRGGR